MFFALLAFASEICVIIDGADVGVWLAFRGDEFIFDARESIGGCDGDDGDKRHSRQEPGDLRRVIVGNDARYPEEERRGYEHPEEKPSYEFVLDCLRGEEGEYCDDSYGKSERGGDEESIERVVAAVRKSRSRGKVISALQGRKRGGVSVERWK